MEQLIVEFTKLVNARIDSLKDSVSGGMIDDIAEYKRLTGLLTGLRETIDLIDQAKTNILKR